MDIPGIAKLYCPECGQKLAVPTKDLRTRYRCPRCQTVHSGADLVPKRGTVPAVPVEESVTYESDLAPEVVGRVHDTLIEEPPPATVPMPTVPIPTAPARIAAALPATQPMRARPMPPPAAHYQPPPVVAPALQEHPPPPVHWPVPPPMYQQPQPPQPAPLAHPIQTPSPQGWGAPQANVPPPALPAAPFPVPAAGSPLAAPPGIAPGAAFAAASPWDGVAAGLRAGAHGARGGTMRLLRASRWLANHLTGPVRGVVVVGVSLFATIVPWIDRSSGWPTWLALSSFVLLLLVFLFAWIERLTAVGARALAEVAESAGDVLALVRDTHGGQRAVHVGTILLFVGLALTATANVLGVCDLDDASQALGITGGALVVLGAAALWFGWRAIRRETQRNGLTLNQASATSACIAMNDGALSPVVDCSDVRQVEGALRVCQHALVAQLLSGLAAWHPRGVRLEREYQRHLVRRLTELLPEANPRKERAIGEGERADILLGDSAAGVLIEMKVDPNNTDMDGLSGQAERYALSWGGRGPILLLVCKASPAVAPRLAQIVQKLRASTYAALGLLVAK